MEGGIILSTCNRTEFYTASREEPSPDPVYELLSVVKGISASSILGNIYQKKGEETASHFNRQPLPGYWQTLQLK